MSISWYYVYSQRYEALHHMFKDSIKDPRFNVTPLFVEQSEFNKTTYNIDKGHFLSGCFIKQEIILHILKKLPTNSYFLFTDVDFVIINEKGLYEFFQGYMDRGVDMAYMWEGDKCNVGFSLLKANEKTIAYFEAVVKKGRETSDLFDMEVMFPLFPEFRQTGTIEILDKSVICLSNYYNETEKSGIKMLQVLCSNSKNYKVNMMEKYMNIKAFGVPIEKYITMAIQNGRTPDELGLILNQQNPAHTTASTHAP